MHKLESVLENESQTILRKWGDFWSSFNIYIFWFILANLICWPIQAYIRYIHMIPLPLASTKIPQTLYGQVV